MLFRSDENVACVQEWAANIFFYRKGDTTIMVDAGYNYDRLDEKMSWLGIDPKSIHHILITHQDTDHVGAVEADLSLIHISEDPYRWDKRAVSLILERREYTGCTVNFKTYTNSIWLSLIHIFTSR